MNQRIFWKITTIAVLCGVGVGFPTVVAAQNPPRPSAGDEAKEKQAKEAPKKDDADKPKEASPPRPIEFADTTRWERLAGFSISNDGKWAGHMVLPGEGDGQIVIQLIGEEKRYEFKVGRSSTPPRFSHDGKWVAFRQVALEKEAEAAQKANKQAPAKVVLIELESGKETTFEDVSSFSFSGEASTWLAIRNNRPSGLPSGDDGWSGADLILHQLATGKKLNFGNVSNYSFNEKGTLLAIVIDAQGKLGNGLQLFDPSKQQLTILESEAAKFSNLSWNEDGDALALLKQEKHDDFEEPLHHLIAYRNPGEASSTRVYIDVREDAGIENTLTISPNQSPYWSEDRTAVFYGVHDAKPKPKEEEKKSTGKDEKDAGLVIWHWQDKRLQSQQQVQESSDKRFNYLCVRQIDSDKSLKLGDDELRRVMVRKPHRFAVAIDNTEYELSGSLDGQRYSDVYVIDLKSGKKRLALKKSRWMQGTSPDGTRLLYYEDGNFHTYNMATGNSVNITENVPTSFIDTEDDHNVDRPPTRTVGWSNDGEFVLISDNWDIWKIPAAGGEAVNMTKNGKTDSIRYQTIYQLDPDEDGLNLSEPLYVSMYGEWTKKDGIGLIEPGADAVKPLLWDDASFGSFGKLEDHDVYYYSRQTENESPQMFVAGADLADGKQLTKLNEFQPEFLWSSGVKLIDYESTTGEKLQAALYLPADYVEGKSYPTIVYIYEKLSNRAHSYSMPRAAGFSQSVYTSQGFAVLTPDIVYRVNDPGLSSVECVIPAIDAAVASGIVDNDRIGLHGHSWGGYQTSFLITQTDRFKAAAAGAPLTNLISMYSSIYWNSGSANQPIFESSQGRFTGGYWTNLQAYARNSPVYHAKKVKTPLLLLHNDKDGAVDWNQGIEYFNTLRRLEKPVVMLQYKGENHGVVKPENRKDYSYRMFEFFDHYLRGADAPDWWADGISHLDMEEHISDYRKAKTESDESKKK